MTTVARSWTDAVTNAALFAGFDAAAYLKWLATRGGAVNAILPQFLHEFTHHWCFDSVVGNAFALLTMRARRNAYVFGLDQRRGAIESDLLRATAAEVMLQPLAEGLALFAEFDMSPGSSQVQSRTTTHSLVCFGFPLREQDDTTQIVLRALLQTTRRSAAFLERKAGVYAQPFDCEDGYLAGYLSVKALWAQMAARDPRLRDTDLYLAFLRSYIYDDAELVLTMLRKDDDEAVCRDIANHICRRFASLAEGNDLATRVAQWEAACASGEPVLDAIGITPQAQRRATDALHLLMGDVSEEGEISDFATHAWMTLEERQYMTLGSVRAVGRSASGVCEIAATADPGLRYTLKPGLAHSVAEGEIVAVTPTRVAALLLYFVAGGECHLLQTFGDCSAVDLATLRRHLINRGNSVAIHEDLEAALAAALLEPALASRFAGLKKMMLKAAEDTFGALATLHCQDAAVAAVLTLLRQGGMLAVLDYDVELVRAVASIGLANTMGSDPTTLSLFALASGLTDEIVRRTLSTAGERNGMRLLSLTGSGGAIAVV